MSQTKLPIRFEWQGPAPSVYPDRVLVPISTPGIPGGGGGAPTDATYITLSSNGSLSAERVLSNGAGTDINSGTAGQVKIDLNLGDTVSVAGLSEATNPTRLLVGQPDGFLPRKMRQMTPGAVGFPLLQAEDAAAAREILEIDESGGGAVDSVNGQTGAVVIPPAPAVYVPDLLDLTGGWRKADDYDTIQDALDAAGNAGGGVVLLGPTDYTPATRLSVPAFVTLKGTNGGPTSHPGYRDAGTGQPTDGGTRILVTHSTLEAVRLTHGSTLDGVCFYYPSQVQLTAPPTVYPPTIKMRGNNPTVRNVELLNSYIGLDINNVDGTLGGLCQRPTVDGVTGQPLYRGIVLGTANDGAGEPYDGILDCPRISNVHFNPWWSYPQAGTAIPSTLYDWQVANGVAFDIGDVDELLMTNCFAYGYSVGLKLSAPNRGAYGSWTGGGLDYCTDCVQSSGTQDTGISFTGIGFVPTGGGTAVRSTGAGTLLLTGCRTWNIASSAVVSAGKVAFSNHYFRVAGTHVTRSGGTASVVGGFATGGLGTSGTVSSTGVVTV